MILSRKRTRQVLLVIILGAFVLNLFLSMGNVSSPPSSNTNPSTVDPQTKKGATIVPAQRSNSSYPSPTEDNAVVFPLPFECTGKQTLRRFTEHVRPPVVERHRPPHIQAIIDEIERLEGVPKYLEHLREKARGEGGSNDVSVNVEDIERARNNFVNPLPDARIFQKLSCDHKQFDEIFTSYFFYDRLRDHMQSQALDAAPIIVDIGCVVGEALAVMHPEATVICLHDRGRYTTKPHAFPEAKAVPNLIQLFTRDSLWEGTFAQFFEVCNFFTVVFALQGIAAGLPTPLDSRNTRRMLEKLLPSAALVFSAVPIDAEAAARPGDAPTRDFSAAAVLSLFADARSTQVFDLTATRLATVAVAPPTPQADSGAGERHFDIVQFRVLRSKRPCRKTWNAPLVQWGREQSVLFEDGRVTFSVTLRSDGGRALNERLRVIHPLSYMHCINFDTLLGAGLPLAVRIRFLGEMIGTPRYSDPLPHNWVLVGGGRLVRIDKEDKRYDAKVDESKGYWGHSTRGYLHLLGYHLCIDIADDGIPTPIKQLNEVPCTTACALCADQCSYLPKGTLCNDCNRCGRECLVPLAARAEHLSMNIAMDDIPRVQSCQKTYKSMHAARAVWRKWEQSDGAQSNK